MGQLKAIASKPLPPDSGVPFDAEQALFYSAFIARKLLENRKLTDAVAEIKFRASVHEASPEELAKRAHPNSLYFEIGREFADGSSHEIEMRSQDLLGEIIHSFFLLWSCCEHARVDGFFLASYKTHKKRALWVSLEAYIGFLEVVAHDVVTESRRLFDPDTGQTIVFNS